MNEKSGESDLAIYIFLGVLLFATAIILIRIVSRSWTITANVVGGVGVGTFCYFYWDTTKEALSRLGEALSRFLTTLSDHLQQGDFQSTANPKLTGCPDCESEISINADTCPECGHSFKRKSSGCGQSILVLLALITGVAGLCFWPIWLLTIVFVLIAVASD